MKHRFTFLTIVFLVFFNLQYAYADDAYLFYEKITEKKITKDVVFKTYNQVTNQGLRDIYVLEVPTNDKNIIINNTSSKKDFNFKETVQELINSSGAVAGINGDFFAMSGAYSIAQGTVVNNGELIASDLLNNLYKDEYATFLLDKEGNPFIDYLKVDIDFLNNGVENLKVHYYNKYSEMTYPIYIDRKAMASSVPVDQSFANVSKIVVKDGVVTYISTPGEKVDIPENGYVIMFGEHSADYIRACVKVSDKAEISINTTVDLSNMFTTMGGGGKLLEDGQIVYDDGFVPEGRHPRTSLGYTKDNLKLIMVVVDGRGKSIGANKNELANIMIRLGAYDAVNLDGGGSSTMVIKEPEDSQTKVVNIPSDGRQRKVINSLGVYNKSEKGELASLKIELANDKIIFGLGTPYTVTGLDEYLNQVPINLEEVVLDSPHGEFKNNMFYPNIEGDVQINATYKTLSASTTAKSLKLIELIPNESKILTYIGQENVLSFTGKSVQGYNSYLYDGIQYEIYPADFGTIENNIFKASKDGSGYIKAQVLDVVYYIDVIVGLKEVPLIVMQGLPEVVFWSNVKELYGNVVGTGESLILNYKFNDTADVQTAAMQFTEKVKLEGEPRKLKLLAIGDNSHNILKATIIDNLGNEHYIKFTDDIDFKGYKELEADLPSNIRYPIFLDKVYVDYVRGETNYTGQIGVKGLNGFIVTGKPLEHPKSTSYHDVKNADLNLLNLPNSIDVTAVGDLTNYPVKKPEGYLQYQQTVINKFVSNSTHGFFVGNSDYFDEVSIKTTTYGRYYGYYNINNIGVVFMVNNTNNFYSSNAEQWQNIFNDIKNKKNKNIIIQLEKNPLTKTNAEFEFFHSLLAENIDKNIFVVSSEGNTTSKTVMDGIRYINLGGLFKEDQSLNTDFRVLRFRISDDDIFYDLQKVF